MYLIQEGYCPVCQKDTIFRSTYDWLRDHYLCDHCKSLPRQRALHYVLNALDPHWREKWIHESSPGNDLIRKQARNYSASHYWPDRELGKMFGPFENENLEKLTFTDNTFDYFISLDVMEHVFHPDQALQEMARTVKPAGFVVFTTPIHEALDTSKCRAVIDGHGDIEHLEEPNYHGNPIGDNRSLVTWDYGNDFVELVRQWSRRLPLIFNERIPSLGIDGKFLDVIVIRC
jgi:SAM-dependent methyltransferase